VPRGKLVLVNDDDLTYCALRLDPDSLVTLIDRIGDIAEPLPRPTLDRMNGWLSDVEVPDKLVVDTDLRWRLLHALVAHGVVGPERIEEELAGDPTSTGQRQAERARSLVPTAEAKARAWERAVHDDTLPNAVTEAIIGGFAHHGQRGLLAPYVERYFAEVADVWQRRTSEHAQAVVIGLFPSWAVDKATVDAADAWLADSSHPPALRRLVSEGRGSSTGPDPDRGTATVAWQPRGSDSVVTRSEPPSRATSRWLIDRPSPEPPAAALRPPGRSTDSSRPGGRPGPGPVSRMRITARRAPRHRPRPGGAVRHRAAAPPGTPHPR
jgi:hypothetical protein